MDAHYGDTQFGRRPRLVYITTHAMSAEKLMTGQLAWLRRCGFDVTVIAGPSRALQAVAENEGVETIAVPLMREIDPWHDLRALVQLYRHLRRIRPEIVNAGTPKAGFLGMLAALLARVPSRIYTLRGLRLETTTGLKHAVLSITERIASFCSQKIICVSPSIRQTYIDRGLTAPSKAIVLANGSSNGVDAARFDRSAGYQQTVDQLRSQLEIPAEAPVIGFIGRLTRDKGITELFDAFQRLLPRFPSLHLLLVGEIERGDSLPEPFVRQLQAHRQVVLAGNVADTAAYYGLIDVVAFPSYREGFPNVPLEAAAAGLPVVGYRATGTVDAVQDGVTGTLVDRHDVDALADSLQAYLEDELLRQRHGQAGRRRVLANFRRETIWQALFQEYVEALPASDPRIRMPDMSNEFVEPPARAA